MYANIYEYNTYKYTWLHVYIAVFVIEYILFYYISISIGYFQCNVAQLDLQGNVVLIQGILNHFHCYSLMLTRLFVFQKYLQQPYDQVYFLTNKGSYLSM